MEQPLVIVFESSEPVTRQLRTESQIRWGIRVDQQLKRFVEKPLNLRPQLRKYGSLISGSFAVQFFVQEQWLDSDLGIFVEKGDAMQSFDNYLQRMRRLGDRFTWTVPLPTENVEKPKQPDFVLEYSSFILTRHSMALCGPNPQYEYYCLLADRFRYVTLDFRFVYPCGSSWVRFLGECLHHHAWLRYHAMKPEEHPQWFRMCEDYDKMCIRLWEEPYFEQFQRPDHWRTFDQDIPNWYDEWFKNIFGDSPVNPLSEEHPPLQSHIGSVRFQGVRFVELGEGHQVLTWVGND